MAPKVRQQQSRPVSNKWTSYLGILKVLNIMTIVLPIAIILGFMGILAWRQNLVGLGYLFVILSPAIFIALAVGLGVAALNVLSIPLYLIKYRPQSKKLLLGWILVALSALYIVVAIHFTITRRFPW